MSQTKVKECLKKHPKGLTYDEIAEITGLSQHTVKNNLRRLRISGEAIWAINSKTKKPRWFMKIRDRNDS